MDSLLLYTGVLVVGGGIGYGTKILVNKLRKNALELEIARARFEASKTAESIIQEAEKKARATEDELMKLLLKTREEHTANALRLKSTEDRLSQKEQSLDEEKKRLLEKETAISVLEKKVLQIENDLAKRYETIAGISENDARAYILAKTQSDAEQDIISRLNKFTRDGAQVLEQKARDILVSSIHRLGNLPQNDVVTTNVEIPSEDIKGKIIGKEGRNIRVFERLAGVELLIDESPNMIVISSFDPLRRHIAKTALEYLIADGRIQPAKIEECIIKAQNEIEEIVRKEGEAAVQEVGLYTLDPRLMVLLGRLHFRTSYGQNVLQHSIEMAHIAGMLAHELKADVDVAKAGALLHDIGKAVDHEVEGTHVEIGRRILSKFGVDERIIHAMQAHHEEYPYETIESVIVQVADAISGGRPGARRDTVENYLKRLNQLEAIANSFAGIEKSFALQAGRELRIFVTPEAVSELMARNIARDIALRIERELRFPGEIKVHVIRETRVIEVAR